MFQWSFEANSKASRRRLKTPERTLSSVSDRGVCSGAIAATRLTAMRAHTPPAAPVSAAFAESSYLNLHRHWRLLTSNLRE